METYEFFATCPFGFESILADELRRLRIKRVRPLQGGVAFFGTPSDGYRSCLWSRCASRVLMVLDRVSALDADTLYQGAYAIAWQNHIGSESTLSVSSRGTNAELRNSQFTALKVKDAICDKLRMTKGFRPDISSERPDVSVWVTVNKSKATIYLDFAGESLHRRGYRNQKEHVQAPIKEALAASILLKAGWQKTVYEYKQSLTREQDNTKETKPLVFCDPLCGSGTFLIEAAMIASDMAPGILRDYWGFYGWLQFNQDEFDQLLDQADQRLENGLENMPHFIGFDIDSNAVEVAKKTISRSGLSSCIRVEQGNVADLKANLQLFEVNQNVHGFIATNPPYGVRLLQGQMEKFYRVFADGISSLPEGWQLCVITPEKNFDDYIGLNAKESYPAFNGKIETTVRYYDLGDLAREEVTVITLLGKEVRVPILSSHADQFVSRLRKNAKARRKWARKNNIHAYRIYDSDLPDYAVAIDVYETIDEQTYLVITEYKAPKTIDSHKALKRFLDVCSLVPLVFELDENHVFTKTRQQAKGGSQYAQNKAALKKEPLLVEEDGLTFEVDLDSYLDTGLFIDHRKTRALVGSMAQGKRFLNLFAYTGTASVYAARGGSVRNVTVDLSQTYLDWAKRNMHRAGFKGSEYVFIKEDVLEWVKRNANKMKNHPAPAQLFDLVFVDPPTFSNSKSMGKNTWDIQRNHAELLIRIFDLVAQDGKVVFSGNLRTFRLDESALNKAGIVAQNITEQTIPEDFQRNKKIHFCYILKRAV